MTEPSRTLTVGEIADAILRPGGDRNALIARIRHWTREGLLQSADERRSGTGHYRRYPLAAVLDAAVLRVLANMGLQAGPLRQLMGAPNRQRGERIQDVRDGFLEAFLSPRDFWWEVSYAENPEPELFRYRYRFGYAVKHPPDDVSVDYEDELPEFDEPPYPPEFNDEQIEAMSREALEGPAPERPAEWSPDIVLAINLTRIFKRIRGDDLRADLRDEAHRRLDQRNEAQPGQPEPKQS